MSNEPSWDDIFRPQEAAAQPAPAQDAPAQAAPAQAAPAQAVPVQRAPSAFNAPPPMTRREAREAEARRATVAPAAPAGAGGTGGDDGRGPSGRGPRAPREPKRRNLLWLKITLPIVLVLGALGSVGAFAWINFEPQVRELLGWQLPNDYEGSGNDTEVVVTVSSGDIGEDVARKLHDAGVTMTFDAFYTLLLEEEPDATFMPGNYSLRGEMSARAAFDALQNPDNKITNSLLITEGSILPDVYEIIANTTGLSLEEVQAAGADVTAYGLPATEVSLEGWLFPATYQLDGGESAASILQMLVNEMISRLDAAGVAPEQRHEILTKAALVQREAGANPQDFYKIARVFQNRLDNGWNLESDATVAYGTGNLQTVWTTDAERADASNLYNTYANPGLPIGPIGAPGDLAIDAVLNPADGPWFFFVPINLATGETVFSETADQQQAAVEQLRAWCDASTENASYCE